VLLEGSKRRTVQCGSTLCQNWRRGHITSIAQSPALTGRNSQLRPAKIHQPILGSTLALKSRRASSLLA
jgi:hypothetical protein